MISFTSAAAEWDNGISDYWEEEEIITFKNGCVLGICLGDVISQVQLKTPKNFKVARGYNYVWELDAWVYEDYNDFLKGFEFQDMNNGRAKVNRDIDIKILSYEGVEVEDYYNSCNDVYVNNETFEGYSNQCERILNGSHTEQREVWKKVTPADIKKADGKVTLRGYTNVQQGDKIDWSPLIFGVRVSHDIWAEWSQSDNVGIFSYYRFDEASGNSVDATSQQSDATATSIIYGNDGIINDSYTFGNTADFVDLGYASSIGTSFTINTWVYLTSVNGTTWRTYMNAVGFNGIDLTHTSGAPKFNIGDGSSITTIQATTDIDASLNTWFLISVTYDDTDNVAEIYINGVSEDSDTISGNINWGTNDLIIGNRINSDRAFPGRIDGIGIWQRRLSQPELLNIYLSGVDGNEYQDSYGVLPSVTLISPIDNANLTSSNIDFITTVTDAIKVDNVTLYIDGLANETNTSGFNGTYTFSLTLANGDYNWSILAWNNQSLSNQSETRDFNINVTLDITLNFPIDNFISNTVNNTFNCSAVSSSPLVNISLYGNFSGTWGLNSTDVAGTYTGTSFSLSSQGNFPAGITWDDSSFWVVDGTFSGEIAYEYYQNGTYTGTSFSVASEDTSPAGITWDDSSFWVVGDSTNAAYEYYQNGTYTGTSFSVSSQDSSPSGITWDDSNFWVIGDSTNAAYEYLEIKTLIVNINLSDSQYIWNCEACIDNGNCSFSENNRTIFVDTTPPQIQIIEPQNISYTAVQTELNYTVSNVDLDTCWYSLDEGITNVTIANCLNVTDIFSTQDTNTWTVWANDTAGDENSSSVTFFVDSIPPNVEINSPLNITYTTNEILFDIGVFGDIDIDICWYNLNDGDNITLTQNPSREGIYSGISFDTSASGNDAPFGITDNETYIWTVDNVDNLVYKYWINGTYTGDTFDIATSGNADAHGITQNNTFFWITDSEDDLVYKYWMNGTYTGETFDTAASGNEHSREITENGTYFWITDSDDSEVYKYWMNGTYTDDSFDTAASGNLDPRGIIQNNTLFWIIDISDNDVHKYHMNGTYVGEAFFATEGSTNDDPRALTRDSLYFYITDPFDGEIYQYWTNSEIFNHTNSSVPNGTYQTNYFCNDSSGNVNDTETVTFSVDTTHPQIQITNPIATNYTEVQTELNYTVSDDNLDSCWYSLDGGSTNVTVASCLNVTGLDSGQGSSTWIVYANDTAGNLNSSSVTFFVDSIHPEVTINSPINQTYTTNEILFSVNASDEVGIDSCWYNLDEGDNVSLDESNDSWDLSKGVYDNINLSEQDSSPQGMFFKSDGTSLYYVGANKDLFYQYTCSSNWALSTCSYDNVNLSTQGVSPIGMFFKSDGTNLYEVGTTTGLFYQYTCTDAWNLSSCSYDSVSLSTQDTQTSGMFFKSDGTKLYEVGRGSDLFYQYTCTDAWNLTSCSYDSVNLSTQDLAPSSMFFKSDGTKLYEAGEVGNLFYQYSCSSAWDLSSCSYDSVSLSTQDIDPTGMFFKSDGTKLYEVGLDNHLFYQYTLGTTFNHTNSSVPDGTHTTNYFCNDSLNNVNNTESVVFTIDTSVPVIDVESPNGTLGYNIAESDETLNVTFTDTSLESCWYNYNGTNITIEGCASGVKNSTEFTLEDDNFNMTVYANDSFGNFNSAFIEWEYILLEYSTTYDSNVTEGETNTISIKVLIDEGSSITDSVVAYNGFNYTTSVFYDGENYTIFSDDVAPTVSSDTNYSFNFIISVDDVEYETTTNNQTVFNADFGICGGVSNDTLLNMSLFDEELLTDLTGDIEFNADIISKSSGESVEIINGTFNNTHSGAICFSPVSSYDLYYLDVEIRYSTDDYAAEFYYIQNADMADYPVNLSLYDLNLNDSTEFDITYKNNNFIFIEGAVIQLQRKYIGEDIYRTVEAPLTSDGGKAILHIDLNTNKYQASVVKDGELLDFFENIVFSCENELSGECTYSLDGTVDPNNDVSIEDLIDFTYSISVDEDNQTITVAFAVPSGTPSSINVLLEQIDMFGNLTSCNTTIVTSAGSITCDYTDTIEKSILELSISKDDVQLTILSYANDPDLDMDGMNFFIVFLFMISLVGMAIASPEWMIIISVMVLIISGTMLLLKGMSLVMGLGAIAWVIVAAAIIILKMAKQEDR